MPAVERDRRIDVVDDVADADRGHGRLHSHIEEPNIATSFRPAKGSRPDTLTTFLASDDATATERTSMFESSRKGTGDPTDVGSPSTVRPAALEELGEVGSGGVRDRVEQLVRHAAETVADPAFPGAIPALVDAAERDEPIRAIHHRYAGQPLRNLVDTIVEGVASGAFPERLDPELAALELLGPIFFRRLLTDRPFPPARTRELVESVLAPPAGQDLHPIGFVESPLTDPATAPKQGSEGSPEAWLVFHTRFRDGLRDLTAGSDVIVLTWLDRADRDVLVTHPRDDASSPLRGIFSTRSADRPNPIGLHRVRVVAVESPTRIRVGDLEAVDGTPVLDVKPALDPSIER
jgi:tRNA-Thr(GGU) m(6)t(6)A37 methyltransferase TsaA